MENKYRTKKTETDAKPKGLTDAEKLFEEQLNASQKR